MNDTKQFTHGEEGTHYACPEMMEKFGGEVGCCGCNHHECRAASNMNTKDTKTWEENWKTFWKPLLLKNGEFDENKIKNEMHDLVFIFEQVGEVYMYITGGMLSKPMYYASAIKTAFEDAVQDAVQDELAAQRLALKEQVLEAVGGNFDEKKSNLPIDLINIHRDHIDSLNDLREEIKERIEAVFEKGKV